MRYRLIEKGWAVLVSVRGHYAGFYRFTRESNAKRRATTSLKQLGVLGCNYRVKPILRLERVS